MKAKVLYSGLKFPSAYPWSIVALSYYSNQQTYCHKQTRLPQRASHPHPPQKVTQNTLNYLLFHILLLYTIKGLAHSYLYYQISEILTLKKSVARTGGRMSQE